VKPGEVVAGGGAEPSIDGGHRARVSARNLGELPVYVGSHFELARLSGAIELDRGELVGARLTLPAGTTLRIGPGEAVELDVIWD
jgi:urease subunit beta